MSVNLYNEINKIYKKLNKLNDDAANNTADDIKTKANINNGLKQLTDKVNDLIDNTKALQEYVEATSFLNWFKFNYINNKVLQNEAKNKLIKDLSFEQTSLNIIPKLDFKNIDLYEKTNTGCVTLTSEYLDRSICTTSMLSSCCIDWDAWTNNLLKKSNHTGETEEQNKPEQHKPADYVWYVVKYPYLSDKNTLYKVYKYLKHILEKDKELGEYLY